MMNFITQTEESNSRIVIIQAEMIKRYYPQSTFYVYDGGLSTKSKNELDNIKNVEIIDWRNESDFASKKGSFAEKIADIEELVKKTTYTNHLVNYIFGYDYPYSELIKWNFFIKQKPRAIVDLAEKNKGNIIWMDDDCVLVDKFDDVYKNDFDIGVTARSKYHEMKTSESSINSGVIFFNTSSKNIQKFAEKWLCMIEKTSPTFENPNVEQDMLEEHPF